MRFPIWIFRIGGSGGGNQSIIFIILYFLQRQQKHNFHLNIYCLFLFSRGGFWMFFFLRIFSIHFFSLKF